DRKSVSNTENGAFKFKGAVMVNDVEVAGATSLAAAVSVYPTPLLLMLRPGKVAIPSTVSLVNVPESVPSPGLFPKTIVTVRVEFEIVFPNPSWTATRTAGVMGCLATVEVGCTTKFSLTGTAAPPLEVLRPLGSNLGTPSTTMTSGVSLTRVTPTLAFPLASNKETNPAAVLSRI